ncbi:MAG: thiol:disulfide interchange protein DsbA/DsbL [Paucibacter sp.]|nr:thiol:disulfide interchange protein DsbA/DsbL [Roseateles sp.]
MQRRNCLSLLALAAGSPLALAQGTPQEGVDYRRLSQPLATSTPGKIELIEFFWYGCPHCFVFDPALKQWLSALPADVSFRRVHVGFGALHRLHQRFFYALEALGLEDTLHDRVFKAFHVDNENVDSDNALQALAIKLGVDGAKFRQAWASFGVQSKCMQATRLSEDFRIDGVPSLGIGGRFLTAPSMAGRRGMSEQQIGMAALRVTDYLLGLMRQG